MKVLQFPALLLLGTLPGMAATESQWMQDLRAAPSAVVLTGGVKADPAVVQVKRSWKGAVCTASVVNQGSSPGQ